MLSIELDIYSGRPNPQWVLSQQEEQDLVDLILADPSLMLPIDADTGGLGYRGYIVRAMSEDGGAWSRSNLPSQFRVGGELDPDKAASLWLLDTSEKRNSDVDDYLREYTKGTIDKSQPAVIIEGQPGELDIPSCNHLFTSDRFFDFWNASSVILLNNSYNFASNNRTNTYAQPGRRSGRIYPMIDLFEVAHAARRDGYYDGCLIGGPTLDTALVIAPGPAFVDFHWYRLCQNNHWCHKPGTANARNTDNSGLLITDPRRADRGPYTEFVCFFYGRNPVNVS